MTEKLYKPLQIALLETAGLMTSLEAMRAPLGSKGDSFDGFMGPSDKDLARRLIRSGDDHAKAMRGIEVWVKLQCQVGWMIEFVTYRIGCEDLSTSSSMHNELKALRGAELAEQKQADLPRKYYTRYEKMSYQAMRRMYFARRGHRHPDWKIMCQFIESLPYFDELINIPSARDEKLEGLMAGVIEYGRQQLGLDEKMSVKYFMDYGKSERIKRIEEMIK